MAWYPGDGDIPPRVPERFSSLKNIPRNRSLAIDVVEVADCLHRVRINSGMVEGLSLLEMLNYGQCSNELGFRGGCEWIVDDERVFCGGLVLTPAGCGLVASQCGVSVNGQLS